MKLSIKGLAIITTKIWGSAIFILITTQNLQAQTTTFWSSLEQLCGKAFEGEVIEAPENEPMRSQKLVMHVRSCEENVIKIPFFVGENSSRTWVLTQHEGWILLKHDHRHEDGSEDEITQYGGWSTNQGLATLQMFPADQETAELIPTSANNNWWIEVVPGEYFTYNLRRIGTDLFFSVKFDLKKVIEEPEAPWGWEG